MGVKICLFFQSHEYKNILKSKLVGEKDLKVMNNSVNDLIHLDTESFLDYFCWNIHVGTAVTISTSKVETIHGLY